MSKIKTYSWQIYSSYGSVRATNIKNATIKMIKNYMESFSNDNFAWGEFSIKEDKYEIK